MISVEFPKLTQQFPFTLYLLLYLLIDTGGGSAQLLAQH